VINRFDTKECEVDLPSVGSDDEMFTKSYIHNFRVHRELASMPRTFFEGSNTRTPSVYLEIGIQNRFFFQYTSLYNFFLITNFLYLLHEILQYLLVYFLHHNLLNSF